MIYGSVCSGIEVASVAWLPLGWRPAWFSEVEPFCRALLSQHYPDVRNLGDMTEVLVKHEPINLLVGGTPCQSFSVNGMRQGLADPRGNLTLHYVRLLEVFRPWWFVWENVPGVLSADGGGAFRRFLSLLVQCGYGVAWRVLDGQHFGIPQRRRRLFVVGHTGGNWHKAAAVLFDARGCPENALPPRKVRQGPRPGGCGGVRVVGWTGDPTPKFGLGVSPTLRSQQGGEGAGFATGGKAYRFTPKEWERLQGLPDDYTLVDFKGKPAGDRQRIHALGNAFPVPVLHWIGQRIQFIQEKGL